MKYGKIIPGRPFSHATKGIKARKAYVRRTGPD